LVDHPPGAIGADPQQAAIAVSGLGKCFRLYDSPQARLKQALWGRRRAFYREFWALRAVSFACARGESLAIIGRNGSGKSTLLQLICGTLTPTEGRVRTQGRVAALLELGSGFNPEFTGLENVFLNAALLGLSEEQTRERLDAILAFADIGEFVHQPVKTYSSGMQLRLAFAVLTQAEAEVLVIDEALAVGDAVFTQRCMRFIHRWRERRTLLLVSHDAASVAALTDRCLWLRDGRVEQLEATAVVLPYYVNFCQQQSGAQRAPGAAPPQPQPDAALPALEPADGRADPLPLPHPAIGGGQVLDHRQSLVRYELLEMAARPSAFNGGDASSHRDGQAEVLAVQLQTRQGQPLAMLQGGEICVLRVRARALRPVVSPIIGFAVLDGRGQTLFGENTYGNGAYSLMALVAGEVFEACFQLEWPWLAAGEYAITVAVASGGRHEHVNHCWLHACLVVTTTPGTRLVNGIFSPPMLAISLEAVPLPPGSDD